VAFLLSGKAICFEKRIGIGRTEKSRPKRASVSLPPLYAIVSGLAKSTDWNVFTGTIWSIL